MACRWPWCCSRWRRMPGKRIKYFSTSSAGRSRCVRLTSPLLGAAARPKGNRAAAPGSRAASLRSSSSSKYVRCRSGSLEDVKDEEGTRDAKPKHELLAYADGRRNAVYLGWHGRRDTALRRRARGRNDGPDHAVVQENLHGCQLFLSQATASQPERASDPGDTVSSPLAHHAPVAHQALAEMVARAPA